MNGTLKAAAIAIRYCHRDIRNIVRYGRHGPRFAELIWVPSDQLKLKVDEPLRTALARQSGNVLGGNWDQYLSPLDDSWKHRAAIAHWRDGTPWQSTGAYDAHMKQIARGDDSGDGYTTIEQLQNRYRSLDAIFETVSQENRLRPQREMDGVLRELGGIMVHLTRDGLPVWGRDGSHRLAMVYVLGIPVLPAMLGVVHPQGLTALSKYRSLGP